MTKPLRRHRRQEPRPMICSSPLCKCAVCRGHRLSMWRAIAVVSPQYPVSAKACFKRERAGYFLRLFRGNSGNAETKFSMITQSKIVTDMIVSSRIGSVKRGWNTVRKQFTNMISNPVSVNAAAYDAAAACFRIFATRINTATLTSQKNRRIRKLKFFG